MFFFKQKTAYEMRISDWSSDVCSSDLSPRAGITLEALSCMAELPVDVPGDYARPGRPWCRVRRPHGGSGKIRRAIGQRQPGARTNVERPLPRQYDRNEHRPPMPSTEERRVGPDGVNTHKINSYT